MKRFFFLIVFTAGLFHAAFADYSLPKSILFSAAVPGSGQLYLNKPTKSGIFLAAEIALWFSYSRFRSERNWAINSYEQYANSIINLDKNSPESDYRLVQRFFSSEDYNDRVREFARDRYLMFANDMAGYYEFLEAELISEEEGWHWQSTENWEQYKQLRRDKQDYEIYANFAIGALVLNRIVSVIDAAFTARKMNRISEQLTIRPDFIKNGFEVSYEIPF